MLNKVLNDNVKLKRAYEPPELADGYRVLIDRLWPRGLPKQAAHLELWMQTIAPSPALRKWFAHDPSRWAEFRRRYKAELKAHMVELEQLRDIARRGPLTLVYSAHDTAQNNAIVVRNLLLRAANTPLNATTGAARQQRRRPVWKRTTHPTASGSSATAPHAIKSNRK